MDWFASILVAGAIVGQGVLSSHGWEAWMPLLVFLVEGSVLTPLVGGSFGQLLLRVAVVRLDRRPVNLLVAGAADPADLPGRAAGDLQPGPARPARPGRRDRHRPALTSVTDDPGVGQRSMRICATSR